jgi:uncharacterized protein DUF6600
MRGNRIVGALLALIMMSGPGSALTVAAQPVAAVPPQPPGMPAPDESGAATPPRVSYLNGEVSFWRQGAADWAPAQLNTPLAPGDVIYTGQGGAAEIQIGRAAFVRAGNDTQIGLDNQEPDFFQFRVTGGHAGIDLRQVPPGATVEIDTPQAAFTVEQAGYYRLDVDGDSAAFTTYRGGAATMTLPGGAPAPIASNQQVVLAGTESPGVTLGAAPPLNAWDNWNYQRSAYLLRPVSQRYVAPAVYGTEELDTYGTWRNEGTYGSVWVPSGMPAGWQPYSTGRWIWDPRFGWTWLDDAPWGWAPYHYGRWISFGSYWGWAPGPVVVTPAYAPALVVFLGGVSVSVGVRPVYWAPLGWGEPVVPWWGRPGFAGHPWWGGWGGPRVVNDVVINRNTTVNVSNITVYRNVNVNHAVVGVSAERFGRGPIHATPVSQTEVQQLRPVHGSLGVRPAAASVMPATGPAIKPPASLHTRPVVATRAPRDLTPALREQGLTERPEMRPAPPRLVPSSKRAAPPEGVNVQSAPSAGKAPAAPPGAAGPAPRGPERATGSARTSPPPSSVTKAPSSEMPSAEGKRRGGPERPAQPSAVPPTKTAPTVQVPRPEQRQGGGERPLPNGSPQAPAPPSGVAKAPPSQMPSAEGKRGGGPERPVQPSPAPPTRTAPTVQAPRPEPRQGGGERPLPKGFPQAQAPPAQPLPAPPTRTAPTVQAPRPEPRQGGGERPLLKGSPQAQAPAAQVTRPGPPPRAEHPKRAEQPKGPAPGEQQDKGKER